MGLEGSPGAPARSSLKFLPGQIPNPSVHNGRLLPSDRAHALPPRGRGSATTGLFKPL